MYSEMIRLLSTSLSIPHTVILRYDPTEHIQLRNLC